MALAEEPGRPGSSEYREALDDILKDELRRHELPKAETTWRPKRTGAVILVIVVLVGANLWGAVTGGGGPDPAVEALHSPQEATSQCQASIESRFASQSPSIAGSLQVEYLQGGEYEVRGSLELRDGSRRVQHEVLCVAQFTVTEGWDAEEILLGGN